MTGTEGVAPRKGGAPRGKETRSELREVYKILHLAGKPLTVPEIAERMPKTGWLAAAMNAYREHLEATLPSVVQVRSGTWTAQQQREAMEWWVRKVVSSGVRDKIINANVAPQRGGHGGGSSGGTYVPGPKPPHIRVIRYVEKPENVEYSPELDEQLSRGHVAGMEYIKRYDEMTCDNKKHTIAEWKALAELGNRAIRSHQ